MAALLIALCWLLVFLGLAAVADRWIPDRVWDKLFRILNIDEQKETPPR